VGLTWFILGLGKKVLIADTFAGTTFPLFQSHLSLPFGYAWAAALAYTLQLYFDFSGYSDMALGLARMFSIDFPLNFNSPFKAASIIDAWQRWHITLGRYIFSYIYNPVTRLVRERRAKQGKGMTRRERAQVGTFIQVVALPMTFTMFIAGIWHGAGLQFMAFGLLHGVYLSVNSAWRQFFRRPGPAATPAEPTFFSHLRHGASVVLVFLCVVVSMVFFRSDSVTQALSVLAGMCGLHPGVSEATPVALRSFGLKRPFQQIAAGLVIVWFLPNTQQILTRFKPSLQETAWNQAGVPRLLRWMPSAGWAVAAGLLFFVVLVELQEPSTFLYFQF
jgi:D-alanyl-lipoteichoic acid acyltransferase DltB (MBOAT superfamily)